MGDNARLKPQAERHHPFKGELSQKKKCGLYDRASNQMRFCVASKAIQLIGNRGVCPLEAIEGMMNALCTPLVNKAKADTEILQAFD